MFPNYVYAAASYLIFRRKEREIAKRHKRFLIIKRGEWESYKSSVKARRILSQATRVDSNQRVKNEYIV